MAEAVVGEKGLPSTTIDDISARAGIAKGTFYHYYRDRGALLEALWKRLSQTLSQSIQESLKGREQGDWDSLIGAWIFTVADHYMKNLELYDALLHDASFDPQVTEEEDPVVSPLVALIERGISAGAWMTTDPLLTARFIHHGLYGFVREAAGGGTDLKQTAKSLRCLCTKILEPVLR